MATTVPVPRPLTPPRWRPTDNNSGGRKYEALLDRADHEAEDGDEAAILRRSEARIGRLRFILPPQVSAAIIRGENRLNVTRHRRDETQQRLTLKTGVGPGVLFDLKLGSRIGPSETVAKLARARDVPVEWLL